MYLAGRNQPLSEYGLEEGFRILKEAGGDAVELCHEHPLMSPERMTTAYAGEVAAMLARVGLRASAAGWHCDYVAKDDAFGALPDLIELTPAYGTDVFILAGAWGADEALWAPTIERTRRLCDAAEGCRVRLAVEYEPGFLVASADALLRLIEEVGSPALGANLDLGHAFLCEDDPLGAIARLGDRIFHCHVENMCRGVHKHRLPWEGDMDLGAYIEALAAARFDGALSLDLYGLDYAAVIADCFAHLRPKLGTGTYFRRS
jgi:sugar phosphate isomerase/epimerase